MSVADMNVQITADIGDLQKKYAQAVTSTKQLSTQVSKSMTDVKSSSNSASFALMNLGRVAQDAPFGFIGIQNNINPLLESFQRLKAETGSTSAAFKALAGGLIGGGGLGLAVSVATGLLTVLAQQGFFKSGEAADKAKDKVKDYKDSLNGIFADSAKEAANATALIAVLNSEVETRGRKLQALQELKKINPEIFNGLKLEHGAVTGLDAAYKAYIANLQNVISAKILQAQIESKITEMLQIQGVGLTTSQKKLVEGMKNLNKERANLVSNAGGGALAQDLNNIATGVDRINDGKVKKLGGEIEDLTKQMGEFSKGIKLDPLKKEAEKAKTHKKTIADVLAELAAEIDFLNKKQITLGVDTTKDKISAMLSTVETLMKTYKVNPEDTIIQKILGDVKALNIELFQKKLAKELKDFMRTEKIQIPGEIVISNTAASAKLGKDMADLAAIALADMRAKTKALGTSMGVLSAADIIGIDNGTIENVTALYNQLLAKAQSFYEGMSQSAQQFANDLHGNGANALGESLAAMLSGGDLGSIFGNFEKQIGEGLISLGKSMIKIGVMGKAIKQALGYLSKNPGLALAAGIATIALGNLIKNSVSKGVPGFAGGTSNAPGGWAMVGERGPELVRLPQGAQVTANNMLGFQNGLSLAVTGSFELKGDRLLALIDRASKTRSRQG